MKLQTRQTSALAYVEAEGSVTAGKLAKYLNTKKKMRLNVSISYVIKDSLSHRG